MDHVFRFKNAYISRTTLHHRDFSVLLMVWNDIALSSVPLGYGKIPGENNYFIAGLDLEDFGQGKWEFSDRSSKFFRTISATIFIPWSGCACFSIYYTTPPSDLQGQKWWNLPNSQPSCRHDFRKYFRPLSPRKPKKLCVHKEWLKPVQAKKTEIFVGFFWEIFVEFLDVMRVLVDKGRW